MSHVPVFTMYHEMDPKGKAAVSVVLAGCVSEKIISQQKSTKQGCGESG